MSCNINNFCYVCGHFTPQMLKHGSFTEEFISAYETYFNHPVISNVPWAPKIVCKKCYTNLMSWMSKRITKLPFGVPMIWLDPNGHKTSNCYACVNSVTGMNRRKTRSKIYKSVLSAQIPIQHSENVPVPKPPSPDVTSGITIQTALNEAFSLFAPEPSKSNDPILITQTKLDCIIAKLGLSQRKSEELARFLNSNNLLAPGTKISAYRHRQATLQECFFANNEQTSAYCKDVDKLMSQMDIGYNAAEWRLFIDSSKTSLKAVLLHQTNSKPSVPIAYSVETKETYDSLKTILQEVDYNKHQWKICCDLKVVAILRGLQSGYIKYMCFLCDWDSRYKGDQYANHEWKCRELSKHANANVIEDPLVPQDKVLLPPLHIKLGIVKSFLKTVVKRDEVYTTLAKIFPRLTESKLKEGVVNGPDIRKLVKNQEFDNILNKNELIAWQSIKEVIGGLLGKNRSDSYQRSVNAMMNAFSKIGVNMSLKIHYLHHHLDYFGQQLATESDEQGEQYHQIAMPFEMRYRGKKSPDAVLAEICWWSKNLHYDDEGEENTGSELQNLSTSNSGSTEHPPEQKRPRTI